MIVYVVFYKSDSRLCGLFMTKAGAEAFIKACDVDLFYERIFAE